MKDYLLIIKTEGSVWSDLSPEQLQVHLEHGKEYIENLANKKKLKTANPFDRGGRVVTEHHGEIKDGPIQESKEIMAGYFLISAEDIQEAVKIAGENPIFKDISSKIEIYPLMPVGES